MTAWSEAARYFTGTAVAHLATLLDDGAPHVVPLWAARSGDSELVIFTQAGSRKDRNILRDPRVAISITDAHNPFSMATVRGEVVERLEGERGLEIVDRIARQYTGGPYPLRTGLVAYVIRPHAWWAREYEE